MKNENKTKKFQILKRGKIIGNGEIQDRYFREFRRAVAISYSWEII